MRAGSNRLTRIAYAAAATNFIAAVLMVLVLGNGLPTSGTDPAVRLAFIRSHNFSWQLGWFAWNVAALTLLGFFLALRMADERPGWILNLAIACAAAGVAADLTAEALMMGLEPSSSVTSFAVLERATLLLTGYVANGLYSVCGAMLTLSWRRIPSPIAIVALPLWPAGFLLSFATMIDASALEVGSTATVMVLFVVWAAMVGRWSAKNAS